MSLKLEAEQTLVRGNQPGRQSQLGIPRREEGLQC